MLKFIQMKKLLLVFGLLFSFTTAFAAVHSVENISEKVKGDRLSLSDVNSILGTIRGFFFDDSTGFVGVGTDSPASKLEVRDDGNNPSISISNSVNGLVKWSLTHDNNYDLSIGHNAAAGGQELILGTKTNGAESMRIDASGNVGIGTSSPGAKLHVEGGMIATGFTSDSSGENQNNYWNKIATCNINSQFEYCSTSIHLRNGGHSTARNDSAYVSFYVKQQGELGTVPQTSLRVEMAHDALSADEFMGVVTQNDTEATVVELWAKNIRTYSTFYFNPIVNKRFEFHEKFEAQADLPDGDQIGAIGIIYSDNTGNVGIGTSSPVATLDVNGSFMAANEHVYSSIAYNIGGTYDNEGAAILEWKEGTTILDRGHVYKVQVSIDGDTGFPTSATYLVRDNSLYTREAYSDTNNLVDDGIPEWEVRTVNDISSGFGQVLEVIMKDGATPDDHESQLQLSSDYSSPYAFRYIVTAIETNNNNVHYGIFGADGIWQRSEDEAYYLDGDVGIGTTEPGAKLEVHEVIRIGASDTENEGGELQLMTSDGSARWNLDAYKDRFRIHGGTAGNEKFSITDSGNVGIGTTAPCDAGAGDGTTISGCIMEANGEIKATNIALSSDSRLKKSVETIPSALEKILSLRGVTFEWKQEEFPERNFADGTQIGLIAQEVEEVFPELVSSGEYKSISYSNLVAPLIEAVKSLYQIDQNTQHQIQEIQKENAELRRRIEELEAR